MASSPAQSFLPSPAPVAIDVDAPIGPESTRDHVPIQVGFDSNGAGDHGIQHLRNIMRKKDLSSLKDFGGAEMVASVLNSHLVNGLSESQQTRNTVHRPSFFPFLLKACSDYTILLLFISALLCLVAGLKEEGPKYGWVDAVILLFVIFLLVIHPSVAKFLRARNKSKKLLNNKLEVVVVRSGEPQLVAASDVVEGDLVVLSKGDRIPADGIFVGGEGLVLDELLDSDTDCSDNPFLFTGSKVVDGEGRMIVTSLCTNTALSELMGLVTCDDADEDSLLQDRIAKPDTYADYIALCMSIVITFVMFIRFLYRKQENRDDSSNQLPKMNGKVSVQMMMASFERILLSPGMVRKLTTSLTAVVLGLQHGVAFVIALSLSYRNQKASNHCAHRNPTACCTMDMATVVCINASGGLLCHQLEVNEVWIGNQNFNSSMDSGISQAVREALRCVISISVIEPDILGSSIDDLLLSWLMSKSVMNEKISKGSYSILESKKYGKKVNGALINQNDGEKNLLLHKGDASIILAMCSHYLDCEGRSHDMGNQRSKFEKVIKDMEDSGIRSIAVTYSQEEVQEIREGGLNLLALVGFKRKPCRQAVEALKKAGVTIKLVSRDEPDVVKAIANELGINTGSDNEAAEGEAFQCLDEADRVRKVDHITVMSRSGLEDTLLMVQALKQKGHVVAYFGGLATSDIPALREADVGFTEEAQSTEMARESSDIIVPSHQGFSPLIPILMSGRCAYHNIQKFVQLMLTASVSGLLISSIATMCLEESPITAIQLIWVNCIMSLLGGLMMVMDLPTPELITHEPQARRTKSILTKDIWRNFVIQVLYQALGLLIFLFGGRAISGINQQVQKPMIFNGFTLCQLFNLFNIMELEKKEVLKAVLKHYWFLVAIRAVIVLQVLVVEFGTSLANYVELNWVQWAFCFLFALLPWGFDRVVKFMTIAIPAVN
ncbi:hypothetical protein F0562_011252 [Nyssa sinensis]|uniref:Uncharacterized protein n=1 Tax=Nyssa sinensis TaxID=561372 RepID=A0A5J5A3G0_9ASTE|nr:hypothetical protein F0562_011252 [Nyssa sinensis]